MNVNYISLSNGRDTRLKKTWQKKIAMLFFFVLFSFISVNAQIDVTASGGTPTASYTTLKGAFDAINLGTHTGTITIGVSANTTETATAVLNASGSGAASYASIGISPTGGAARTISGAIAAGSPMIDLNGADNVTINGLNTGGNTLTLSNTTASATSGTSTIRFIGGATSNTITNCSVFGSFSAAVVTNGGNIFFSTDALTANGNDNNTISFCDIGPAGANLNTKGIYMNGSTTTVAIGNSGNTFNGNNIFNYFGAAVNSAGVYIGGGTTDNNVTNNKFYQTATRTQTTGAQHSAVWITNTSGNNYQVTGNTIGYSAAAGTGTYTFVGVSSSSVFIPIFLSVGSTTATNASSNTITAIAMSGAVSGTTSSAPFRGIYVSSGLTTCNSNTIGSSSATGAITFTSSSASTGEVMGMFNFGSAAWTTNNNIIGGITASNSSTGAANIYGLRCNTSSATTWTATGNTIGGTVANSIRSTSTATGTIVNGMLDNSPAATFTGNTISNLSAAGGTGTGSTASVVGIAISASSANHTVGSNTIFNLGSTLAGAAAVHGINFNSSTGANVIEKNLIYDFTAGNASNTFNGINIIGGTIAVRNNMIRLGTNGTSATLGLAISGINETTAGTDNFYHNSIYIGGAPTAAAANTFAFQSSITTNARNYQNNIFVNNRSNSGSTGKHYAIRVGGTAASPAGLTSNFNILFANGTGGFTGLFNAVDQVTIANWRTATGMDANSYADNAPFLGATASTPNLHLDATISTFAEGLGTPIASVTDDFDGQTRSTLTPVDMGADALNGTGPSVVAINSVSASPSTTGLCTAVSRTITANTTAGASPITSVTLNYAYNGVAQTAIAMTGGTTTGTSDWTAVLPVASPVNAAVTWSVTAVDPILSRNTAGTGYQDEPLLGSTASATATPSTVCAGSTITLNGIAVSPGTRTLGAGGTTSSTTAATFFPGGWGGAKTQYIIKASELTAAGIGAGAMSSLAYEVVSVGQTYQGFAVQLGHTTASVMTTTFLATPMTQVYRGTLTDDGYLPTVGVNTLAFGTGVGSSSSFVWNGTDNIVVSICWSRVPAAATSTSTSMKVDAVGFVSSAYDQTDNATPAAECATVTGDGTGSSRPKFTITGQVAAPIATYNWVDNTTTLSVGTTNPLTITPTTGTTYTVTMTTAGGCSLNATTAATTVQALPTAPTATNGSRCGSGVVTNGTVASTSGETTPIFKWYAASTGGAALQTGISTSYTTSITATTTLYVTEIVGTCESFPRTEIVLTVVPPPTISVTVTSGLQVNCGAGPFTVELSASSLGDPGMTYVWSTSSATAVINSNVGGLLNVDVTESSDFVVTGTPTDPSCNPVVLTYPVSVYALPNANVTTTASGVCAGTSATINSGLSSDAFSATCITPQSVLSTPPVSAVTLINGSGVQVTTGASSTTNQDDNFWTVPIGFSFNYLGTAYTNVFVSTNGILSFTAGTTSFSFPSGFPSVSSPAASIAVCARDMYFTTGAPSALRYWVEGTSPNRRFVVQYDNVYSFDTRAAVGANIGTNSAEAVFYETVGNVDVRVINSNNGTGTVPGNSTNKLIGLQNAAQTVGAVAPRCSPATANYWNAVTTEILAPQAWRFAPPANYNVTWSTVGPGNVLTTVSSGLNVFTLPVTPSVTTVYDLRYTNTTTGCSNIVDSDRVTMEIISNVAPATVAVASAATVCINGASNLSLTGNVNSIGNTEGLTYQWQVDTGAGFGNITGATLSTRTVNPAVTSTYQCLVSACTGGAAVASSPITVTVAAGITLSSAGTSYCTGGSHNVTLTSPGGNYDTYVWTPATGVTGDEFVGWTFNPTTTTTYTLTATQLTGLLCSTTATVVITVNSANAIAAVNDNEVCLEASAVNLSVTSQGLASGPSGLFATSCTADSSGGGGSSPISNVVFGTINHSPAVTAPYYRLNPATGSTTTTVTAGQTYPLTVSSSAASIASVWIDSNRDGVFQTTEFTQLWISATTGTVNITIPSNAVAGDVAMRIRTRGTGSPNGSTDACSTFFSGTTEDYTISVIGVADATGSYTYAWTSVPSGFTASTATTTATPLVTTDYTVTATSPEGCSTTSSVTVTVNTDPVANITGGATTICLGSPTVPATIDFDTTVGALWSSSNTAVATIDANGVLTPLTAGTTIVNARIDNPTTGCTTYAANPQTVTVYAPLAMVTQPVAASVLDYDGVTPTSVQFSVVASGSITGYQWEVSTSGVEGTFSNVSNGGFYSGVTSATLTITNATTALNLLYYRCSIAGQSPCATPLKSGNALLTVSDIFICGDPTFTTPICGTGDHDFVLCVDGSSGYTVVWQYSDDAGFTWTEIDGSPIGGVSFTGDVNSTTLEMNGISSANNGWLIRGVAVLDPSVVFSNPATIVVNQPAVIDTLTPVANQTVCADTAGTSTFTVTATGGTYQWQYSATNNGIDWVNVANANPTGATYTNAATATLTVATSASLVAGPHYYRAVVTSPSGCPLQYSNVAELLINTPSVSISSSSPTFYCSPSGTGVTLTADAPTAATYLWSPATGLSATDTAVVVASPSATTTYQVLITEAGGCTRTAQITVTVGGSIVATATATPSTVCPTDLVQLLGADSVSYPQGVAGYTFAASNSPYATIVGGVGTTALVTLDTDDDLTGGVTLPFTFTYNGTPYTQFSLNTNGYIVMGDGTNDINTYSVFGSSATEVISAFNRDLLGNNTTSTSYYMQTVGTSPNQITKIEWTNISSYSTVVNPATANFQIWLYEGSNKVEMRYGSFTSSSGRTTTGSVQIGLKGATTGAADIRSLSNTGNWNTPTIGTTSASTVALGNFAASILPASGLVYAFTPPVPAPVYTYAWTSDPAGFTSTSANPTVNPDVTTTYTVVITNATGCTNTASTTVTVQSGAAITTQPATSLTAICQGSTTTFNVVATGPSLTYQWFRDATPVGTNSATLTLTNVTPADNGVYTVTVTPICGAAVTSDGVATLTVTPSPTVNAISAQSSCAGTTSVVALSGSTTTFNISGGAAIGLADATGVTEIPSFTGIAGTATITVTPMVVSGSVTCTGTPATFVYTINPTPGTPTAGSDSPVCDGIGNINLTASTVSIPGYSMNASSGVSFIDIAATGTSVTVLGDDTEHNITIPSFTFNGIAYTAARVGMNGAIVFGATTGEITFSNAALPSTAMSGTGSNAFLAPFWDDLDIPATIHTETIGNKFIIQYTTTHNSFTTGSVTFQVQLDTVTGAITYVYPDVIFGQLAQDAGLSATVGINMSTTSAVQYSLNTASLINGQSITFTPNVASYSWTGPNGFTSSLQNPTLPATALAAGEYSVTATNVATGCTSPASTTTVVVNTPTAWYADADGDTYGNLGVTQMACTQPSGYVANSTDCDDTPVTGALIYQFATFYVDADLDTYGSLASASVCSGLTTPVGYSLTNDDCDDTNPLLNPTNPCSAGSVVNLTLAIEGYYDLGTSAMRSVKLNQWDGVTPATAPSTLDVEDLTVELHDATTIALVDTAVGTLHTDGSLSVTFNVAAAGSYYLTVKGSNMIQTWTANPVSIGAAPLSYDFTSSATQAFGSNMVDVTTTGVFAFYSGDTDQNGNIDTLDYSQWELDYNNFAFGVFATDIDGNGNVDTLDYTIWELNYNNFISTVSP